jgi:hypothetical protein
MADFAAPKRGSRISIERLDDRPVDPYYLVEKVDRQGPIWSATITGADGRTSYVGSDQVKSWTHFDGQKYDWDERRTQEEEARRTEEAWQAAQAEDRAAFEAEGTFPNGRVLKENLVVKVKEGAPSPLDLFADQRLRVTAVDMKSKTALMNLMGEPTGDLAELGSSEELESLLASPLPANMVVEWTELATPERSQPIPIWSPDTLNAEGKPTVAVDEDEIHEQFPLLTKAIHDNRVSIMNLNVYSSYQTRDGTGQEIFEREVIDRGGDPENIPYTLVTGDEARAQGRMHAPRGAFAAKLRIQGPIDPEMEEEIKAIAPASQITWLKNGDVTVHSVTIMRAMMLLGSFDAVPTTAVAKWVRTFCRFAAGDPS